MDRLEVLEVAGDREKCCRLVLFCVYTELSGVIWGFGVRPSGVQEVSSVSDTNELRNI